MSTRSTQPAKGDVERSVGFTARFVVYYTRDGKRYWDAMYAPTADKVRSDFLAMAAEIGWKNVVVTDIQEREL